MTFIDFRPVTIFAKYFILIKIEITILDTTHGKII